MSGNSSDTEITFNDDNIPPSNFSGVIGGIILEQVESLTEDNPNSEPIIGSERWIIHKANEVYTILGKGYPECIYHKAFMYELRQAGIDYETEKIVPIMYKNTQVGHGRADIVLAPPYNTIIEFKSISNSVGLKELAQLGHYMKNLDLKTGIIINFSQPSINARNSVDFIVGRVSEN